MIIKRQLKREWYALYTKSRFENTVETLLLNKEIEAFLPKILVKSTRKDRKKMIESPLFPGYIFVKTDSSYHERLGILKTTGAVRIIGDHAGPISIKDEVIESLKIVCLKNELIEKGIKKIPKGTKVIVVSGTFTGVIGIFERYKGKDRVVISIDVLNQYAAVEVNEADIEVLPKIMS